MMPPEKQRPPWGSGRCGTLETTKSQNSGVRVAQFPTPQRVRPGILNYRQQRSVADFAHAVRQALEREATLREQGGAPDQWLRDCAEWIGRGALPK